METRDINFWRGRLRMMATGGHGYFAQDDIHRLFAAADSMAEAAAELSRLRKIISATHKHAVKHENCERMHCPICEGGLFMCADCGAAEIEAEEWVCTAYGREDGYAAGLRRAHEIASTWGVSVYGDDFDQGHVTEICQSVVQGIAEAIEKEVEKGQQALSYAVAEATPCEHGNDRDECQQCRDAWRERCKPTQALKDAYAAYRANVEQGEDDAVKAAREAGRLEGLEIAQSFLVRLVDNRMNRNFSEIIVPLLLITARNIETIKARAGGISPKELEEARKAVKRLGMRKDEDPEEWARRLGKMFANYRD